MKIRDLFKSKKQKHREKLLKDYKEGKVLKFEEPKKKMENQNNFKKQKKKKEKR